MTRRRLTFQNVIVVAGAIYATSWVISGLGFAIFYLTDGWVRNPFLRRSAEAAPYLLGAILIGGIGGILLRVSRIRVWSVGVGTFVVLNTLAYIPRSYALSGAEMRVRFLQALVAGGAAAGTCWLLLRSRSDEGPVASA